MKTLVAWLECHPRPKPKPQYAKIDPARFHLKPRAFHLMGVRWARGKYRD